LVVAVAEGRLVELIPSTERLEDKVLLLPPESAIVTVKGNIPALVAVPLTVPEVSPNVAPGGRFVDLNV
jgi:hypothetical protein